MKQKLLPCGRPLPFFPTQEEGQFEKWHKQLRTYLEANKLKYSEQRWKIAELILEKRGHHSAQEIVREVTAKHTDIGPATVYRDLQLLCDAKLLRETLVDAEGKVVYEAYEEAHHDHIVCLDCNEIFEFHDEKMEQQQERVTKGLEFREVRHRHIIYARCEKMKKKKKS